MSDLVLVRQARIRVVVKISHRLCIKENQGRTPHVSPKRVLDLDEVSLPPPQDLKGSMGHLGSIRVVGMKLLT